MKKNSFIFLLALFFNTTTFSCQSCNDDCSDDQYTARSFMFTRPVTQNITARNFAWHNLIHDRHGNSLAAFQIVGLYQRSISDKKTARYFLLGHKDCLKVSGDSSLNVNSRDIRAEWLGLPSNFEGSFTLDPRQEQAAVLFEYNQQLKKFLDWSFLEHAWIAVSAPFVAVSNNIGFKQFDLQNLGSGNGPRDLAQAFTQKEWCYGKISNGHTDFTLAHIRASFGTTYMSEDNFQIAYYSHFTFSGSDSDPAKYLFDTVVDFNSHFGIGAGVNFQIVLNRPNDKYDVCMFLDLEHTYLIKRSQMRMFDLKGKPWSRYLLLNRKDRGPDLKIPAINVLTRKVEIKPYNLVDFAFGFRAKAKGYEFEIGYGLWGHGDERVYDFLCPLEEVYGIAGTVQGGDTKPRTASLSGISKLEATTAEDAADPDQTFVTLKQTDIDCNSGTCKSAINHKAYITVSKVHRGKKIDGTFGFGAFYEYAQRNSALKQWGLFGKMGASF